MQKAKINGGLWKSRIKRSDNTMAAINGLSRRASRSFLSIDYLSALYFMAGSGRMAGKH
jgi:hypothetical protein